MHAPTIRPADERDLSRLVAIEVAAGQLFHTVGMSQVAADVPEIADLRERVDASVVWVATVDDATAGYICAEVVDANAHVAQVSLAPDYAGQRIGRSLMEFVESWGRRRGCPATTLTTFRDVPWNAPYYLRLGYEILADELIGPELTRMMAYEATLPGLDSAPRCPMVKPNRSERPRPTARSRRSTEGR